MTVDEYRQNNPDYNYPDNVIEECLIRAECAVNALSGGNPVKHGSREYAIAAQTSFLLAHYGEEPGDFEEISRAVIPALIHGGLKAEVIYG